jgi:hypothetical protein
LPETSPSGAEKTTTRATRRLKNRGRAASPTRPSLVGSEPVAVRRVRAASSATVKSMPSILVSAVESEIGYV